MPRGAFRFNRAKLGATYSRPVELGVNPIESCEELHEFIQTLGLLSKYYISKEPHKDGTMHFHVYAEFAERLDYARSNFADFKGVHPNICEKVNKGWLTYCAKDPIDFVTNMNVKKNPYADAMQAGGEEGMNIIMKANPRDFMINQPKFGMFLFKPFKGQRRVLWFYGETYTGKTGTAVDEYGCEDCTYENGFFQYPLGSKAIVIDEVDKMNFPLHLFLKITDRYPIMLNIKNGYLPHTAETIIFTASKHPSAVFVHEHYAQIARRITEIREFV